MSGGCLTNSNSNSNKGEKNFSAPRSTCHYLEVSAEAIEASDHSAVNPVFKLNVSGSIDDYFILL